MHRDAKGSSAYESCASHLEYHCPHCRYILVSGCQSTTLPTESARAEECRKARSDHSSPRTYRHTECVPCWAGTAGCRTPNMHPHVSHRIPSRNSPRDTPRNQCTDQGPDTDIPSGIGPLGNPTRTAHKHPPARSRTRPEIALRHTYQGRVCRSPQDCSRNPCGMNPGHTLKSRK